MMRKSAIYFCLLVFGLLCSAAAKDIPLIADPSVPAAGGRVSVNKDNNGNVRIKLQVEHMAKPGALTLRGRITWSGCKRGARNRKIRGRSELTIS